MSEEEPLKLPIKYALWGSVAFAGIIGGFAGVRWFKRISRPRCSVFVDYSNIGCRSALSPLDLQRLKNFFVKDRELKQMMMVSSDPFVDETAAQRLGIDVRIIKRDRKSNREDGVDDLLHSEIAKEGLVSLNSREVVRKALQKRGLIPRDVIAVATHDGNDNHGRGGFVHALELALERQFKVEIYYTDTRALSSRYLELEQAWKHLNRFELIEIPSYLPPANIKRKDDISTPKKSTPSPNLNLVKQSSSPTMSTPSITGVVSKDTKVSSNAKAKVSGPKLAATDTKVSSNAKAKVSGPKLARRQKRLALSGTAASVKSDPVSQTKPTDKSTVSKEEEIIISSQTAYLFKKSPVSVAKPMPSTTEASSKDKIVPSKLQDKVLEPNASQGKEKIIPSETPNDGKQASTSQANSTPLNAGAVSRDKTLPSNSQDKESEPDIPQNAVFRKKMPEAETTASERSPETESSLVKQARFFVETTQTPRVMAAALAMSRRSRKRPDPMQKVAKSKAKPVDPASNELKQKVAKSKAKPVDPASNELKQKVAKSKAKPVDPASNELKQKVAKSKAKPVDPASNELN